MPELVIPRPLLIIAENLISFSSLFELLLSLLVAGVLVRMILKGLFPVSLLDLILRSTLAYAQYFIIVSFRHVSVQKRSVIHPPPPSGSGSLYHSVYIPSG